MKRLIDKLHQEQMLTAEEFHRLLANRSEETDQYARELANQVRQEVYGNKIYVRGLIEFTNYCKNDCYYCGIRRSNQNAQRYRLTEEDILECCRQGYEIGFRTFVLQGGEDGFFTDDRIVQIVRKIKEQNPDCALTLSIGENQKKATVHTERQGLTGICYDMKRLIHVIICGFIRWKCPEKTAKAVFGYLRNWAIRREQDSWWVHRYRQWMTSWKTFCF